MMMIYQQEDLKNPCRILQRIVILQILFHIILTLAFGALVGTVYTDHIYTMTPFDIVSLITVQYPTSLMAHLVTREHPCLPLTGSQYRFVGH